MLKYVRMHNGIRTRQHLGNLFYEPGNDLDRIGARKRRVWLDDGPTDARMPFGVVLREPSMRATYLHNDVWTKTRDEVAECSVMAFPRPAHDIIVLVEVDQLGGDKFRQLDASTPGARDPHRVFVDILFARPVHAPHEHRQMLNSSEQI